MRGQLIVGLICLFVSSAFASKGFSTSDQILTDYRNAKTYRDFVEKLSRATFPGELRYVQSIWKSYPELLKDTSLPKLIFENQQFLLRDGVSEVKLKKLDGDFHFSINGNEVSFNLYELPTQKMKKIIEATRPQKTTQVLLMPVAWAAAQGQPSKLDLATLSLVNVLMDDQGIPEDQRMWNKAETERFINDSKQALNKSVGDKCLKEIQNVERAFAIEKLPFGKMGCQSATLEVRLNGTDAEKTEITLNVSPKKLSIQKFPRLKASVNVEVYNFIRQSDDQENWNSEGYKDGEAVSDSSSPHQRDQNFEGATQKDKAHIELLYRYMGIAGDADVRDLCGECGKQVNEYTRIVDAYKLKTATLKSEKNQTGKQ